MGDFHDRLRAFAAEADRLANALDASPVYADHMDARHFRAWSVAALGRVEWDLYGWVPPERDRWLAFYTERPDWRGCLHEEPPIPTPNYGPGRTAKVARPKEKADG